MLWFILCKEWWEKFSLCFAKTFLMKHEYKKYIVVIIVQKSGELVVIVQKSGELVVIAQKSDDHIHFGVYS